MKDEVALLATVTLLGVLLQAYFSLQVISARRAFRVSPPLTTGPPEFERVYRAQVNCSEYFPLFLATLWVAGIFFHEGRGVGLGRTRWTPWRPRSTLTRSAHLSQGRRRCAAWSTCSRASATSRATPAPRSSGWHPCTRARAPSGCWWRWLCSACSPTSSRPRCAPRSSDGCGRCCRGPETKAAGPAEPGTKSRSLQLPREAALASAS
uniref:Leukotriene C4 synthase n=1 Tax=Papio anubis TaxID=9555 RepID=A0A8I5N171_PAPAN